MSAAKIGGSKIHTKLVMIVKIRLNVSDNSCAIRRMSGFHKSATPLLISFAETYGNHFRCTPKQIYC
jgi:hypothetical protein